MPLFVDSDPTTAHLKMGVMGFQGSGKTRTTTDTAIGLILHMRQLGLPDGNKPLYFLDTEKGSDWMRPRVAAAGVKMIAAKTRAFADLLKAVPEAEEKAAVLITDSVTHYWVELCESYMRKKNRTRLQFEDWAFLKAEWRRFTDLFVNSAVHIIICGRAGFEYDYFTDEETGKKNLEKTNIKMKAEGEMGYEPDLLVLMERETNMADMTVNHVATILKDRGDVLDGQKFVNPTFQTFLPHIRLLNLGGRQMGVDTSRTSDHIIPADKRDHRRTQRKIVLAEIEDLLVLHFPSTAAKDKAAKISLLRQHFDATWTEMEEVMTLEVLRSGFDRLYRELEGKPSRYAEQVAIETTAPPAASEADPMKLPDFLDRAKLAASTVVVAKLNGSVVTETSWTDEFLGLNS